MPIIHLDRHNHFMHAPKLDDEANDIRWQVVNDDDLLKDQSDRPLPRMVARHDDVIPHVAKSDNEDGSVIERDNGSLKKLRNGGEKVPTKES